MGQSGLHEAISRGAPLVDVVVQFRAGIDYVLAVDQINTLAEDFHLSPCPWYDDPRLRIGTATKEALERLFGWCLKRVPVPRFDEQTQRWDYCPNYFMWGQDSPPCRYPFGLEDVIEEIGLSQPGADDDGQWYE
jgi:hypothetical protein